MTKRSIRNSNLKTFKETEILPPDVKHLPIQEQTQNITTKCKALTNAATDSQPLNTSPFLETNEHIIC